ncbi:hypothetical protein [Streptomyces filamentosus]
MSVLRQITTCTAPSTLVIVRASRRTGREADYRLEVCRRHRWLADQWSGRRSAEGAGGRCGTVHDHRDPEQVIHSHFDLWIHVRGLATLEEHDGDVARALRAAHQWMTECRDSSAPAIVLDHAARIADALAAGTLPAEDGQQQLLAALSAAETLDAADRGA